MLRPKIAAEIARQEFRAARRDYWTWIIAAMLTLISLAISYFGLVRHGKTGLQNFDVTITSLVSLVIYLVPLIALLQGYGSVSGEREQGSLSLLLSLPVSYSDVIFGKFMGLALGLMTATGLGFGISGLFIIWRAGTQGWLNYIYFLLTTIALGLVFLSLGLLISVLAQRKAGAAVGSIFLWFFFTFIYDMMVLGIVLLLNKGLKVPWLAGLLYFNPGDIYRLSNLLHLKSLQATMGLSNMLTPQLSNAGIIIALFLAWILLPLAGAVYALRARDV